MAVISYVCMALQDIALGAIKSEHLGWNNPNGGNENSGGQIDWDPGSASHLEKGDGFMCVHLPGHANKDSLLAFLSLPW